jgi:DNA polymerase III alpha subunit
LQNLERKLAKQIVKERNEGGLYPSFEDFISRIHIGIEQVLTLIRSGCFNDFNANKAALMWEAHSLLNKHLSSQSEARTALLFPYKSRNFKLPELNNDQVVNAYDEIELIGFPVSSSYFDLLETSFRGEINFNQMKQNVGKTVRMLGQLVTIKYVKTVRKDYMHFATFVDAQGNLFDSVHFPDSAKAFPFRGDGIYLLLGKIVEEFSYPMLEVHKMAKMPLVGNPVGG